MDFSEDGIVALLLTMALSPETPEAYARPLDVREFRALEAKARASRFGRLGKMLNADVSALMLCLGIPESEAIRLYTLMNRMVQLMYLMDRLEARGIRAVTCYDDAYPRRLRRLLGGDAPAFFYVSGSVELLNAPAVALMGMPGVRTNDAAKRAVGALAAFGANRGYALFTGGEPGVSRAAAAAADEAGGALIEAMAGGMGGHLGEPDVKRRLESGRTAVISLEHPDAAPAPGMAAARNRLMFALSDAAFIFNTDGRRGEAEALQNKTCAWIYAWASRPESRALIARGAAPFGDLAGWDLDALSRRWSSSDSEQLSMFDVF